MAATYEYAYDAGDNMLAKVEPFENDFNDGTTGDWIPIGPWTGADHYLKGTNTSGDGLCAVYNDDADFETWISYCDQDTSSEDYVGYVYVRWDTTAGLVRLAIRPSSMTLEEYDSTNGWVELWADEVGSDEDVWYTLYFRCVGENIVVRRARTEAPYALFEDLCDVTTSFTTTMFFLLGHTDDAQFGWDNVRIVSDDLSTTTECGYDASNAITSATLGSETVTYMHDDWGRMVSKSMTGHDMVYAYRYGDKLKHVTKGTADYFPDEEHFVQWLYDGLGKRRIKFVDGTATEWYRWDAGWGLVGTYEQGGGGFWDVGDPICLLANPPGAVGAQSALGVRLTTFLFWSNVDGYIGRDHLGSVRALYGDGPTPLGTIEYAPYGEQYAWWGLTDSEIPGGYTGHLLDAEVGLYYAPYRYYSPDSARWMTRDRVGLVDGMNLYAYVNNNPMNAFDQFGLKKCCSNSLCKQDAGNWYNDCAKEANDVRNTLEDATNFLYAKFEEEINDIVKTLKGECDKRYGRYTMRAIICRRAADIAGGTLRVGLWEDYWLFMAGVAEAWLNARASCYTSYALDVDRCNKTCLSP